MNISFSTKRCVTIDDLIEQDQAEFDFKNLKTASLFKVDSSKITHILRELAKKSDRLTEDINIQIIGKDDKHCFAHRSILVIEPIFKKIFSEEYKKTDEVCILSSHPLSSIEILLDLIYEVQPPESISLEDLLNLFVMTDQLVIFEHHIHCKVLLNQKFTKDPNEITAAFILESLMIPQNPLLRQFLFESLQNINPELITDAVKLFQLFQSLSKTEDEPAFGSFLGYCYQTGIGVEIDCEKAVGLYIKSSNLDCPIAKHLLGKCYFQGIGLKEDRQAALDLYKNSAAYDYFPSMYSLACYYFYGIGFEQDFAKAFELYHRAAQFGHNASMYHLGYCYKHGKGVKADQSKAFGYFRLGVKFGNRDCLIKLGYCYKDGIGVERNPQAAIQSFHLASQWGAAIASAQLGYMYVKGKFVEKDLQIAFNLYELAIKQGSDVAFYLLGKMYAKAAYVKKDLNKAVELYQIGSKMGCKYAMYELAKYYRKGIVVQKDQDKAIELLCQAAQNGLGRAQEKLNNLHDYNEASCTIL